MKGVNHQCVVSQCPTVSQCDGVGRLVVCLLYDYDLYGLLPDGHYCCQVTAILSLSQSVVSPRPDQQHPPSLSRPLSQYPSQQGGGGENTS